MKQKIFQGGVCGGQEDLQCYYSSSRNFHNVVWSATVYSTLLTDSFCSRYRDGEHLSAEDQKAVVEKLLAYHPHSEDKIGCGLNSVMVSPQFMILHIFS